MQSDRSSIPGPVAAYRRYWLPELIVLITLAAAAIVLFAVTSLDIETLRPYYRPGLADPWPIADHPLWSVFYRSAPWITASLALLGTALLIAGTRRERSGLRWHGSFILLCVILGPGLVINVVLKDHWGRPRPRQLTLFGGDLRYVQPFVPSGERGKSFPCGHCSVAYLYGAGWWLWRRSHPRWAALSLAAGLALGTLLGFGRMAAGAHFLSDAAWSALIAYAIAHCLYYYVLRIPAREDRQEVLYPHIEASPRRRHVAIAITILLCLGIIGGGILASPIDADLVSREKLADLPARPEAVEVVVDSLDIEIGLVSGTQDEITTSGVVHGFGLPTNEIVAGWTFEEKPVPLLRYRAVMKGLFTDIDGRVLVTVPAGGLRTMIVRAKHGDITIIDKTDGSVPLPRLDVRTDDGTVQMPGGRGVPGQQ